MAYPKSSRSGCKHGKHVTHFYAPSCDTDAVMSANCFNTPCHSVRLASLMLLNLFPSSEYLGVDMEDKRRGDAVNCEVRDLPVSFQAFLS